MEARVTGYLTEIWRLRYFWLALVRNDLPTAIGAR